MLVNQASLSFDTVNITYVDPCFMDLLSVNIITLWFRNITNEGFDVSLHGQLTGTGPLDALITFVEPVT